MHALTGRIAIVTGATRSVGIGAAICRALAAKGADICFTHFQPYDQAIYSGVQPDDPARLEAELRGAGVRVASLSIDLSQPDAYLRVLDGCEAHLGAPTILINNAAYSTNDGYQVLDATTLDTHYAVNVRSTLLLSAEFARRHGARGDGSGGRIIAMTSGQGVLPMPDELAYIASKGAIEAFTMSLATAVGPLGITVNAVDPGPTDTGWMTPELKEILLPRFPLGRIGLPTDAASLVAWLATDEAGWITGQVIRSRGGFF